MESPPRRCRLHQCLGEEVLLQSFSVFHTCLRRTGEPSAAPREAAVRTGLSWHCVTLFCSSGIEFRDDLFPQRFLHFVCFVFCNASSQAGGLLCTLDKGSPTEPHPRVRPQPRSCHWTSCLTLSFSYFLKAILRPSHCLHWPLTHPYRQSQPWAYSSSTSASRVDKIRDRSTKSS